MEGNVRHDAMCAVGLSTSHNTRPLSSHLKAYVECRNSYTRGYAPLGSWQAGVDEMPSSPQNTQSTWGFYLVQVVRVSRKTLRPACLSLLDKDVTDVCTRLLAVVEIDFRPLDLAILGLSLL
jgi:hypothetical protein